MRNKIFTILLVAVFFTGIISILMYIDYQAEKEKNYEQDVLEAAVKMIQEDPVRVEQYRRNKIMDRINHLNYLIELKRDRKRHWDSISAEHLAKDIERLRKKSYEFPEQFTRDSLKAVLRKTEMDEL